MITRQRDAQDAAFCRADAAAIYAVAAPLMSFRHYLFITLLRAFMMIDTLRLFSSPPLPFFCRFFSLSAGYEPLPLRH